MKEAETSQEAIEIYNSITPALEELSEKLVSGNHNLATPFVYQTLMITEIDNTLKKLKLKRTIVKQDNVQTLEDSDVDNIIELMNKLEEHDKNKTT